MEDRRPASLLPAPLARLAAFALLAALGVLEWARMADAITDLRALSWVAAGLLAAGVVLGAARTPRRLPGDPTMVLAALAGLVLAFAVSGIDFALLKPGRWGELAEGVGRGAEALGGARLPYGGADPWPADTLGLAAALLCSLTAMLAVWPRGAGRSGYPGPSLLALLVLVVAPVVSMGDPRPLVLGAAVAGLTASFLWLERVPVRPGVSAVVLAVAACGIALPLGTAADREEPWFDYRAFAEGLGPVDPVSYRWDHEYGPIDWPREGLELFRVQAREPFYWKALTLDDFDGEGWVARTRQRGSLSEDPRNDLAFDWLDHPEWNASFEVSLRRLRTPTVVGAGTILGVSGAPGSVRPDLVPGRWVADPELHRGDSYTVRVHVPRPTAGAMRGSKVGTDPRREGDRRIAVNFRPNALTAAPRLPPNPITGEARIIEHAEVQFSAFEQRPAKSRAIYREAGTEGPGETAMRASTFEGTWRLSKELIAQAGSAYDYALRVNNFLRSPAFRYTEIPLSPPAGVPALEYFLTEGREGYCQHFSGAMALLMRMGGVPARVVTGFSPGGFRKKRGDWIVRDTDAHSWVEVWFDRFGWVTFDPTPPATPARSQVAAIEPVDTPGEADLGTTAGTGSDNPARPPGGLRRDPEDLGPALTAPADGARPWWAIVGAALALTFLVAGGLIVLRRRRHSGPAPSAKTAVDRAVAELESALRRCGRPAPAATTLAQLERRLGTSRDGSSYLRTLRAARYGTATALPSTDERRAFRRELAVGLGWRGVVLAWWALPPRLRSPLRPR